MDQQIKRAGQVVQSFVAVNREIAKFTRQNAESLGLTAPQMGILNAVYASPGSTLKEVTDRLFLSKSTASTNVDSLVDAGLVERITSEDDRREVHLSATVRGKDLAKKSCESASSYRAMAAALAGISEKEIEALLRAHEEIAARLKEFSL